MLPRALPALVLLFFALALAPASAAGAEGALPVYAFDDLGWAGKPAPEPRNAMEFFALVGTEGADKFLDEADPVQFGPLSAEGVPLHVTHREKKLESLGEDAFASARIYFYGLRDKDGKPRYRAFAVQPKEQVEWVFSSLQVCREVFAKNADPKSGLTWELLVRVAAEVGDRAVEDEAAADALVAALGEFVRTTLNPLGLNEAFQPHQELLAELRAALWVAVNERPWGDPKVLLTQLDAADGRESIRELLAEEIREQYQAVAKAIAADPGLSGSVLVPGVRYLRPPEQGFKTHHDEEFFRRSEERRAREVILEGFRQWWARQGMSPDGLGVKSAPLTLPPGPGGVPDLLFESLSDPAP